MTKPLFALAALLSAATLASCSRAPEPTPIENDVAIAPVEATPEAPPVEAPPAPAETPAANAAAPLPREEASAPDEQMMDDAAATGMTARATRGEPAPTEAVPVEQVERK